MGCIVSNLFWDFYIFFIFTWPLSNCCSLFSGGRPGWHVFYHFVGAVPGSTELFTMLKRLLLETSVVSVSESSCISHFMDVTHRDMYVFTCWILLYT